MRRGSLSGGTAAGSSKLPFREARQRPSWSSNWVPCGRSPPHSAHQPTQPRLPGRTAFDPYWPSVPRPRPVAPDVDPVKERTAQSFFLTGGVLGRGGAVLDQPRDGRGPSALVLVRLRWPPRVARGRGLSFVGAVWCVTLIVITVTDKRGEVGSINRSGEGKTPELEKKQDNGCQIAAISAAPPDC